MHLKFKSNEKRIVCDGCGFAVNTEDAYKTHFNTDDTKYVANTTTEDYCLKCHPKRMTYMQLIEWLAKGNGYVCQQGRGYSTYVNFHMGRSIVTINEAQYYHKIDDQLEYDEHELVVRYFDTSKNKSYWNIPTEAMFLRDCRPEPVPEPLPKKKSIWKRMWEFLNRPVVIVRH